MEKNVKLLWLSGFVDGNGCFSFSLLDKKKKKWHCVFKVGLSIKDRQLLSYIKQIIGEGKIDEKAGLKAFQYRIRRQTTLIDKIKPLFESYPLYTQKAFYFNRWLKALEILENKEFSGEIKHNKLTVLYNSNPLPDYKAPFLLPPSKGWVVGFVEAEGSFYIVNKGGPLYPRYVHAFGITQKTDRHLLEYLRVLFSIKGKVKWRQPQNPKHNGFWSLESTSISSIELISAFFEGCFLGRKSLVFRIWKRTLKHKGNPLVLAKIQSFLKGLT